MADLIKSLRASRKTCEESVIWQLLVQVRPLPQLQGYLTPKKHSPPRTLQ